MSKTMYLECYSGISGDMTVAALLDLGADEEVLRKALNTIPVKGFRVEISRKSLSGIDTCDFNVILDAEHENHDHDMEYLFGDDHDGHHEHDHTHAHTHDHSHEHGHHDHSHEHRNLPEIMHIIDHIDMTESARELAKRIFTIIAEAESRSHGLPIEEVHFHEVGAVDSIVDIVAAAVCYDNLGITKTITSKLYEGRGFVRCQHGEIPIPVPAVSNIVREHGLKLHLTEREAELVTPTGAAIVAAISSKEELPEGFSIERVGIGAGKRAYKRPSMVRAMLIHEEKGNVYDEILKMETNIDDCSGEQLGYVMERLLEVGARDVYYTPIYMKKNRPAYILSVLCIPADEDKMANILFKETTTIGIRTTLMKRHVLRRTSEVMQTKHGEVAMKKVELPDGTIRKYPEYESVRAICAKTGKSYGEIYGELYYEGKA
ncbi:MAG: nickel pincer cofactor biosynthesis protein LarC [Lachnospiraceae bacterium]|jgi:hypothetical protein|nr:nickel pincer cofactor biosynthesis protein LarC [Lachnospiraceae bacterium]